MAKRSRKLSKTSGRGYGCGVWLSARARRVGDEIATAERRCTGSRSRCSGARRPRKGARAEFSPAIDERRRGEERNRRERRAAGLVIEGEHVRRGLKQAVVSGEEGGRVAGGEEAKVAEARGLRAPRAGPCRCKGGRRPHREPPASADPGSNRGSARARRRAGCARAPRGSSCGARSRKLVVGSECEAVASCARRSAPTISTDRLGRGEGMLERATETFVLTRAVTTPSFANPLHTKKIRAILHQKGDDVPRFNPERAPNARRDWRARSSR